MYEVILWCMAVYQSSCMYESMCVWFDTFLFQVQWNINDFKLTGTEYQNGVRQYFFDEQPGGIFQLHMPSVSKVQAGSVTFVATNPAGTVESSSRLDVYGE